MLRCILDYENCGAPNRRVNGELPYFFLAVIGTGEEASSPLPANSPIDREP